MGDVETSGVLFDPRRTGSTSTRASRACSCRSRAPRWSARPTPSARCRSSPTAPPPCAAAAAASWSARTTSTRSGFILDDVLADDARTPTSATASPGPVTAIVDYSFGNFKYLVTTRAGSRVDNGLKREVTEKPTGRQVAIASMNVENLGRAEPGRRSSPRLAHILVDNLRSPDIVALEEIQDNDGAATEGDSDASLTWNALHRRDRRPPAARATSTGRSTRRRAPDGGEPGGNIRVGFLYRTDRGLQFVDRAGRHRDHRDDARTRAGAARS